MVDLKKKSLSLLARVRESLFQLENVVLHRHGRHVTSFTLPEYLHSEGFARYREFERCADFALAAYQDDAQADAQSASTSAAGWEPVTWPELTQLLPTGRWNLPGLKVQAWHHAESHTAVIAFRGTRVTSPADWYANLRWITCFIPWVNDHYVQVRYLIPSLVAHLKSLDPQVNIIATGHSLGGGLAQHAAYSSPDIQLVHAFAPSPVTGFYSVDRARRERSRIGTLIIRSFEHGEVLAYLRFLLRRLVRLSEIDPEVVELRFNCSHWLAVSEHSMHNMHSYLRRHYLDAVNAGLPIEPGDSTTSETRDDTQPSMARARQNRAKSAKLDAALTDG